MKKPFCLLNISRNEKYMLPIFLKFYKNFFNPKDIYILDHNSDDGSTDNLDVNVIKINYQYTFHHEWLKDTVKEYQQKLLEEYEIVVFAETDELLYSLPEPLNVYLDNFLKEDQSVKTCTAHEILHDIDEEEDWSPGKNIMDIRKYWYRPDLYDKTLISKIPLDWSGGFHRVNNVGTNNDGKLFMLHLHRFDFQTKHKRNIERLVNLETSPFDHDCGGQNKTILEQENKAQFYAHKNLRVEIDTTHRQYLKTLL